MGNLKKKSYIYSVHQAKTQFSKLLRQVEAGDEVIISRGQEKLARLVQLKEAPIREMGFAKGVVQMASDFDDHISYEDFLKVE
jgi:prevent-host-death family protein